jgi:2-oxoglutarate ferredoxin oxidoreductase subunit beta
MTDYYADKVYELPTGYDTGDFAAACAKAREWDYNTDARIALGILYRKNLPTFDERASVPVSAARAERNRVIARFLEERT